jgi:hypothetical protein
MKVTRHIAFRVFVGTLSMVILSAAVSAQSAAAEGVQLFNGRDGTGLTQPIPIGVFQVDGKQLSPGEDKPNASVKVSKDYFIRFCAEKDGSGKCEEFGEGVHNLTSIDFKFVKVWKGAPTATTAIATPVATAVTPPVSGQGPPLTVYERKNWLGRSQVFGPGMYRSFRGEFGKINDNQAMSVIVSKGFRVRFCADEGINFRGSGDCEVHEEGRHNLRFANTISFIEVTDLSDTAVADERMPVVLYEDSLQTGKMQGFDVGTFRASQGEFRKLGNDQALSIAVKDGYRAAVCSDEPVSTGEPGNCEEFGQGRKNLKNKKSASYLRVWKESK